MTDRFLPRSSPSLKFRNILVHGYETVNLDIVRDVVDNHLDDLLDFSSQVRSRLQEEES